MFIRTLNLFLRPSWPEDWQVIHPAINDEYIVRNLARAPWPYSTDDAREFAARGQDADHPNFLVCKPTATGGVLVGSCGLGISDTGEVELGYWVARPHWGKGYASEAARAVLTIARVIGHRHLVAGHFIDNPASGRVLEKIGFRPTGQVRPRFSAGRGYKAAAKEYALDLGEMCGVEEVKKLAA